MNRNIKLKYIRDARSTLVESFLHIARPYMIEVNSERADDHEAFLQSMLQRQGERGRWLALFMLGRECVGFAHFKVDHDDRPGWGYVMEYYVVPQRRREGLGRRFYTLVQNILRIAGCREIWLVSHPPAETFWRACGFTETGQLERHRKIMTKVHKGTSNE